MSDNGWIDEVTRQGGTVRPIWSWRTGLPEIVGYEIQQPLPAPPSETEKEKA